MSAQTIQSPESSYLRWHFTEGFVGFRRIVGNFLEFLVNYFSLLFLLRTMFAPYKRIYRTKRGAGFSFSEFFDLITFNLISRFMGALIRTVIICVGVVSIVFIAILGGILIVLWLPAFVITFPAYLVIRAHEGARYTRADFQQPRELIRRVLSSDAGAFLLPRLGLTGETVTAALEERLQVDASAITEPITDTRAFLVLYDNSEGLKKLFFDHALTRNDITWVVNWYERRLLDQYKKTAFWERDYLLHIPSIGRTWVYGYTPILDERTENLAQSDVPFARVVGREEELFTLERVLAKRTQANVILVGEAGVGKHPLLVHLAHLIEEGRVLPELEGKRVLMVHLEHIFSSEFDLTQRKTTLSFVLEEAESAGNVILVIDSFDRFIAAGPDRLDLTDVFIHTLTRGQLHLIGLVSPGAYHQFIEQNRALINQFEAVHVQELGKDQAMSVIADALPSFEQGFFFQYDAIKALVDDADRFIKSVPFPEKALDLLDQFVSDAKATQKSGAITASHLHAFIEKQLRVPITLTEQDETRLLHLEETLHKRIIGQDYAIQSLAQALRRARSDVSTRVEKPIGTFLFLGPTGVGKTETAKALAALYFGTGETLTRFDMSEFQDDSAIKQFLGDFQTGKVGALVKAIRDRPYAVLLLDELEKAHKELLNIFLPALDEGYISDATGKKTYLTNTIIIATSNAGAEFIRERIAQGDTISSLQKEVVEYIQEKGIFSPEFLNRFDAVIVFHPLSTEHASAVADLRINALIRRMFTEKGIRITVRPETKEAVMKDGFDPQYGGRALARAIQTHIENPLSQKILEKVVTRGGSITI